MPLTEIAHARVKLLPVIFGPFGNVQALQAVTREARAIVQGN